MDIVVGKIRPAKEEGAQKKPFYKDGKKSSFKERRKNKQDRRKSVREGVIVSLSFKDDRRVVPDRRKTNLHTNYTI
jgi:HEAT repeat protein